MEYLFIGGGADGKFMEVNGADVVTIAVQKPGFSGIFTVDGSGDLRPSYEEQRFYRECLKTSNGEGFWLYRFEHLTQADVFRALLKAYALMKTGQDIDV